MARTEQDAGAEREAIKHEAIKREAAEREVVGREMGGHKMSGSEVRGREGERAAASAAREPEFDAYPDFWAHYMREHSRPATRWLHTVGTVGSVALIVFFAATGRWLWLPVALVPGYGLSWIGHFFVEHNRPATFGHPAWSMLSDFRMVWLVLTGRMGRELARLRSER